ncbi:ubiquitin carboxyl-terminal hydrolase 50-like [Littorina saxatilis]|uniref:ubiquitin carboxyl-terminal hydrolase 50-like n=1 Tax=Littorina saxatilis TaxID=31220 RepID=UPI0038B542C9
MLPMILGYALSIHRLQGATLEKVVLNAGPKEFALGLLFVGVSRVKQFQGLAFKPYPNFDRFSQIARCQSLQERLQEEDRLRKLEEHTLRPTNEEDSLPSLDPHPNYDRFAQIGRCQSLKERLQKEEIMRKQEEDALTRVPECTVSSVSIQCAAHEAEPMEVVSEYIRSSSPETDAEPVVQPQEDNATLAVPTGLHNMGNTCYMNSILQCLFNIDPISEYFRDQTIFPDGSDVAREYAAFVSKLWTGHQQFLHPRELKRVLGKRHDIFQGHGQQDAHEFLMFLRERLNDHTPLIGETFNIEVVSTMTCLTCRKASDPTRQLYADLSLPIPPDSDIEQVSVRDCLDDFLMSLVVWKCPRCGVNRESQQKLEIVKFPPFLTIHLKRFVQDPLTLQHRKVLQNVLFPLSRLNIGHEMTYNLCGVVNHYGSLEAGHYTANCYSSVLKQWHQCDDRVISPIDNSSVKTNAAYILFYSALAT